MPAQLILCVYVLVCVCVELYLKPRKKTKREQVCIAFWMRIGDFCVDLQVEARKEKTQEQILVAFFMRIRQKWPGIIRLVPSGIVLYPSADYGLENRFSSSFDAGSSAFSYQNGSSRLLLQIRQLSPADQNLFFC